MAATRRTSPSRRTAVSRAAAPARRNGPVRKRANGRRARVGRRAILRRWLAVVVLGVCAFLYYRPVVNYIDTRRAVAERAAEVETLRAQRRELERRLGARTSAATLLRDARRLGFVKPGERLFIVKGIPEWRRARRVERVGAGATIAVDG
jgi:hypothetical protein